MPNLRARDNPGRYQKGRSGGTHLEESREGTKCGCKKWIAIAGLLAACLLLFVFSHKGEQTAVSQPVQQATETATSTNDAMPEQEVIFEKGEEDFMSAMRYLQTEPAHAKEYLEKATNEDYQDAGEMYAHGSAGLEKNAERGIRLIEKAIERGKYYGYVAMAKLYETGAGVEKDFDKALFYYEQAAQHSYLQARNEIEEIGAHPTTRWRRKYSRTFITSSQTPPKQNTTGIKSA